MSVEVKGGAPQRGEHEDRLHVGVGRSCNNNCLFCIEERRGPRFEVLKRQTRADVRRMLEADAAAGEVMFVSGEPTLNEDLPRYIRWASEMGYRVVGLITNGRRLAYRGYAEQLLAAGLNHVLVSIHGPNGKVHDALTRTPGSYEQTILGLANLHSLRGSHPDLRVHTATCVTRRNLAHLERIVDVTAPLGVDRHVFNVMMPEGRGKRHFDALMPRYSDVVAVFEGMIATRSAAGHERLALLDVPACVTVSLPAVVRGYVEEYHAYEIEDACPLHDWDEVFTAPAGNRGFVRGAITGDATLYTRVAKSFHDSLVRVKRRECRRCRYDRACPGVFEAYVDRYGWEEFAPVVKRHSP